MSEAPADDLNTEVVQLLPQVDALLNAYQALQLENAQLKTKVSEMEVEHDDLVEKTAHARDRVESMINRLKILEQ
ncbi:MAG: TIGR02449 family protein [Methylococcales bacterium]|jgi:cell division protein ZapB|nr:TIGR02449 family protein [Methylococcales bacterium]MBT7442555.1 TIGR02449 family protein [Methylococcales bacterium]